MPLPTSDVAWPPVELEHVTPRLAEWDAWYVGTPERLEAVYGRGNTDSRDRWDRPRPNGPLGRLWTRMWWGRQSTGASHRGDHLHIPVAADLARVSADLLYSEPPTIVATTGSVQTQERLDEYVEHGLHDALASGAEVGAALGGRYHRVTWDPATGTGRSFVTTVDADAALPEFEWGTLKAVTFWRVVRTSGQQVWRHLERHELDSMGMGVVLHGLYEGTVDRLGHAVPLDEHPDTASYAGRVDSDGVLIAPRTPGLCVVYIPNRTPSKEWRTNPTGRHLGESDWAGPIMGLMDATDEAYSSLWRDIRLGKGRIIVPEYMLQSHGPGQGAGFDLDREVYEAVKVAPSENSKDEIAAQQFEIRVEEHLAAVEDSVRRTISHAGYANATLADGTDGVMTATEVHAREKKSFSTRDRKIRKETPAVAELLRKMLSVDAAVFGARGLDWLDPVSVSFPDTVQDSALVMAQTVQALATAQAASIETKVRMVHPDWDEPSVTAEVARIQSEVGSPLGDPFTIGQQEPAFGE